MQYSDQQQLQHLYSIEDLKPQTIYELFELTERMQRGELDKTLSQFYLCNAFFEASTRTICSFELAAKRLGVNVVNFSSNSSSTKKGETLLDTMLTLNAMQFDAFVIRHSSDGTAEYMAKIMGDRSAIINAGDGCNEHPTQALLDAFTISQHKNHFDQLKVAIVGDIAHSRVARSLIYIFQHLGVKDCRLIGPRGLLPDADKYPWVTLEDNIDQGLQDLDVVIMLRMQLERMDQRVIPDLQEYFLKYGLNGDRAKRMKDDAIVMHPGPINREVEIASSVSDGKNSVILEQVRNGVHMRMAVIASLLTHKS